MVYFIVYFIGYYYVNFKMYFIFCFIPFIVYFIVYFIFYFMVYDCGFFAFSRYILWDFYCAYCGVFCDIFYVRGGVAYNKIMKFSDPQK